MNDNESHPSRTYKLRAPGISENAIYFTIVGDPEPEAFFVNTKEPSNFQWVTALMTAYSRQIQASVPIADVIADMKDTFDPKGKYIIPDGTSREAHSIVHHLGLILEQDMAR